MREIKQDIKGTIEKIKEMRGNTYVIRVNRGRNRIEMLEGKIESTYPAIFTVRVANGDLTTFSYADLLSKNILFKKQINVTDGEGKPLVN